MRSLAEHTGRKNPFHGAAGKQVCLPRGRKRPFRIGKASSAPGAPQEKLDLGQVFPQ